jgi:hypothetical protein
MEFKDTFAFRRHRFGERGKNESNYISWRKGDKACPLYDRLSEAFDAC